MDMPARIDFFFSVLASALVGMFASLAAAIPDLSALTLDTTILTDTQMRFALLSGALGGAILSVLIFPPKLATHRTIAAKFFASGLSGVIFAPMLHRWLALSRDFDSVLGFGAVVAIVAIGALRLAVPAWERFAGRHFGPPKDAGL